MRATKHESEEKTPDLLTSSKKDFYAQFLGGAGHLPFSMHGSNDAE